MLIRAAVVVLSASLVLAVCGGTAQPQINKENVAASADLADWTGLHVEVDLKLVYDPRAGGSVRTARNDATTVVNDVVTQVHGTLSKVGRTAIVVSTENAHTWIPLDEVRMVRVVYERSEKK